MTTQTSQSPTTEQQKKSRGHNQQKTPKSAVAVTIGRTPDEVFTFFRRLENLPLFMKDIEEIQIKSNTQSHWVTEIMGKKIEWDARIVSEEPGRYISWQSEEGSSVESKGSIWFTPAPKNSTEVSLLLDYKIPGGKATEILTALVGESPQMLAVINLRRLKALLETGVVPTTKGQPSGREKNAEEIESQPIQKH